MYDITPITFNGTLYTHMELTGSAQKHFGANSERYYSYIVSFLDGQTWTPTEVGKDGLPEFMTASSTTYIKGIDADSDYRETWFRVYPSKQTVQFFHGSSIREDQYRKASHQMRIQMAKVDGGPL